jgi:hypothetical protein
MAFAMRMKVLELFSIRFLQRICEEVPVQSGELGGDVTHRANLYPPLLIWSRGKSMN